MSSDPHPLEQESSLFIARLLELNRFSGEPSAFLQQLLRLKTQICGAEAAAILRLDAKGPQVLALAPEGIQKRQDAGWLREAMALAGIAGKTEQVSVRQRQDLSPAEKAAGRIWHLVFMPVKLGTLNFGLEVYSIAARDGGDLQGRIEALELLLPYFDYFEARYQLAGFRDKTSRLHQVCDTLVKLNSSDELLAASMRLCNELAARWGCSRVSFGLLKGRYIRLKAMSNTEKFKAKIELVSGLENAMEESLDQNRQVKFPQDGAGDYIARAAERYSHAYGPLALLSLPLRRGDQVEAVVTLERMAERPFSSDEEEALRLLLDLYSPRLIDLIDRDKWLGARLAQKCRRAASWLVGAKHTWIKLAAIAVISLTVLLSQWRGIYQVEASFVFEPVIEQIVVAPFPGEIAEVAVRNGDQVVAGQRLVVMDVAETRMQIATLEAEEFEAQKRQAVAMNEGKTAEAQIALAMKQRSAAQKQLHLLHLKQAEVLAPLAGTLVAPELAKRQYARVQFGEELLRVVSADRLKATLFVPEAQIADVSLGAKGSLATVAHPERKLSYTVSFIDRVATVHEQQNVFRVEVSFDPGSELGGKDWAKAGMEGSARIDAGSELYAWIWTRKAINWVRMQLWI
ncbi:MAG: hypothetical protein RL095_912 [Verrucomicrobiota bacterium]|jgi:biotin carboxyl carrier protein